MKSFIKDFLGKCNQIRWELRILVILTEKNFIFGEVHLQFSLEIQAPI